MSHFTLLHYPDPRLRRKAEPITVVNDEIRQLADDMLTFMYDNQGAGLAATQINILKRLIVIDLSPDRSEAIKLINPVIVEKKGTQQQEEGCLSVPDHYFKVTRAQSIKVKALDVDGNPVEIDADDYFAVALQHEIDHLDGILNVDYLSPLKRQIIDKKIKKLARRPSEMSAG